LSEAVDRPWVVDSVCLASCCPEPFKQRCDWCLSVAEPAASFQSAIDLRGFVGDFYDEMLTVGFGSSEG